MTMYRQGDVLLRRINRIPASVKPVELDNGRVVLAYGEVTGHAHAFGRENRVVMFRDDGSSGVRYLEVKEPADLLHEEHSTITIPPGRYEIPPQREYSPQAIRNVSD